MSLSSTILYTELINVAEITYIPFQMSRKRVQTDTIINHLPLLANGYPRDDEWELSNQLQSPSIIPCRINEIGDSEQTHNSIDKFDFSTSAPSRADKVMEVIKNLAGKNQRTSPTSVNTNVVAYKRIHSEKKESVNINTHKITQEQQYQPDWFQLEFRPSKKAMRAAAVSIRKLTVAQICTNQQRQEFRREGFDEDEIRDIQDWLYCLSKFQCELIQPQPMEYSESGPELSLIAQRSIKAKTKLIAILLVACGAERAI